MDSSHCMISSAVPTATTLPPCSPAPGPISTMQSAASIVSSSCSTTSTELPKSRRCIRVCSSLSLSLWCSPMLGSSRIYATPTSPEPICVASRMRCASPPDSVPVARERERYSRPTLMRNDTLARISFKIGAPMASCMAVSVNASMNSRNFTIDILVASKMFLSPTVTARDSFFSRCPLHAAQGVIRMKVSYSAFIVSENVSLYLRFMLWIRPSKVMSYTPSPRWPL